MSTMEETKTEATVSRRGFLGGMGAVLVEGSYIMLERLDKRVNVADNDSRMTIEESPLVAICQALEAAGADALELRLGTFAFHEAQFVNDGVFAGYGYDGATSFGTFFDFDSHFSGLLDGSHSGCGLIMGACRYVKQHVSIPVGGVVLMDPALAPDYFENALKEGWLDMIYMHRPVANCDAEYANKLRENRIDEIRPCCRCLNCLGGLCRVNPCNNSVFTDAMPEGYEVRPANGDKNVMVIGGGPAGMEAARVAAERGYDVTLYEKNGLGGLLDFAEMVKGKHESLGRLRNYLSHMLEVEGVAVVTGQEVDAAFVREQSPDVVIVATGGVRPELAASGSSATPVIGVTDFLASFVRENFSQTAHILPRPSVLSVKGLLRKVATGQQASSCVAATFPTDEKETSGQPPVPTDRRRLRRHGVPHRAQPDAARARCRGRGAGGVPEALREVADVAWRRARA